MGCCYTKRTTDDVFLTPLPSPLPPPSLREPLINVWDRLTAPGGEQFYDNPFELAKPPSPKTYRQNRFNNNKKWNAGTPRSRLISMDGY